MSANNQARRASRRTFTLAKSRASGIGYSHEKRDMRFVITDGKHRIPEHTKTEIYQILQGDTRKGNNFRNSNIIRDTIGITAAELLAISQIIISSTRKGVFHKLTKTNNTNLTTANSSNMPNVSSREVLKNIIKLNISDPILMQPLKQCIYFLEGILNEARNFANNSPIVCKLRLTTSQEASSEEITAQLTQLGIDPPSESYT